MAVLVNAKAEQFAANIAIDGMPAGPAAVKAGYSPKGSDVQGHRLLKNAKVAERIAELRTGLNRSVVHHAISERNIRIGDYNDIRLRIRRVIEERAASPEFAKVPGGKSGLLVKTYRQVGSGSGAQLVEEFTVDTGMLREFRETDKQAAQELGQWNPEKLEVSIEPVTETRFTWVAPKPVERPAIQIPATEAVTEEKAVQ